MALVFRNKSHVHHGIQFGISKGDVGGHIAVWGIWEPGTAHEIFRVLIRASSAEKPGTFQYSYTLTPAFNVSFLRNLEMPLELKEFLTGLQRVKTGKIEIEGLFSGEETLSVTLDVQEFLRVFRGKGKSAPTNLIAAPGYQPVDTKELAEIPRRELKALSDKLRAELEEKRRKAEEERLAKEAAEKAAAKAAADKAAAAKAKPVTKDGAPAADAAPAEPTLKPAKVGIFYGSSTGNTEDVANQLKAALGDSVDYVKGITDIVPKDLTMVETLILGVPTWHIGEMQDDWAAALPEIHKLNFAGKKIAIFGLGDQKGYPDTYVDAMGELLEPFEKTGAKLYGLWSTEGYNFQKSKGMRDGKFLGLVIDIENQNDQTDKRVKLWATQIKKELGI